MGEDKRLLLFWDDGIGVVYVVHFLGIGLFLNVTA